MNSTAGVLTPSAGALCLQDTNDPAAVEPGAKPFPGQVFVNGVNGVLQSVKGAPLPDAPANRIAVDVAYTWHFAPGSLTLSGAHAWHDTQVGSLFNRSYETAPSWDDVDLRALWKGPGDLYEIVACAKNVFNTLQYTVGAAGEGLAGSATAVTPAATSLNEISSLQLNPPRTYGLELRYKFF